MKHADFAGSWYPGTAGACEEKIREFMDGYEVSESVALAGVVPHAGWIFSGKLACRAMAQLAAGAEQGVDTVVVFGGHLRPESTSFLLGRTGVETPLGEIPVDEELGVELTQNVPAPGIHALEPNRFPQENTLELQYPFIKYFFPKAMILPVGIAPGLAEVAGEAVVSAAEKLGRKIRVVGSTDMTHYGPRFGMSNRGNGPTALYWVTRENDAAGLEAMASMEPERIMAEGLKSRNMCCPGAVGATAAAAKKMGAAKGICLDYATSYSDDDPSHFVGYGAILYI